MPALLGDRRRLEFETQGFALAFSTDDMREGTSAFLEKRKADLEGR